MYNYDATVAYQYTLCALSFLNRSINLKLAEDGVFLYAPSK